MNLMKNNFMKNRRFQIENLEERTLLTAAPWSTAAEPDYSGLVVTTLDDVVDASDHLTSIREAIAYAESLGGEAEVTFAEDLQGTIKLTGGAISVGADSRVAIDGDSRIAIDAGGEARAFEVGAAGATLRNLTLTNGYHDRQGGAIASDGDLTLTGVTVTDSYSGKYGSAVYIARGTNLTVADVRQQRLAHARRRDLRRKDGDRRHFRIPLRGERDRLVRRGGLHLERRGGERFRHALYQQRRAERHDPELRRRADADQRRSDRERPGDLVVGRRGERRDQRDDHRQHAQRGSRRRGRGVHVL